MTRTEDGSSSNSSSSSSNNSSSNNDNTGTPGGEPSPEVAAVEVEWDLDPATGEALPPQGGVGYLAWSEEERAEMDLQPPTYDPGETFSIVNMKAAGERLLARHPEDTWWERLVVFENDGEEDEDGLRSIDEMGTMDVLPRHESTAVEAIIEECGEDILVVPDAPIPSEYRYWDGTNWAFDVGENHFQGIVERFWKAYERALKLVIRRVRANAEAEGAALLRAGGSQEEADVATKRAMTQGLGRWKKWQDFWDQLGNQARRGQIQKMTAQRARVIRMEKEFDSDPAVTVFENGVVDFSEAVEAYRGAGGGGGTGGLEAARAALRAQEHDSSRLVSIQAEGVRWDPSAKCPVFERYLETALPDVEVRTYLQRALGSGLLGGATTKTLLNLVGPSNSGKSVLLSVVDAALGDYSESVMAATLLKASGIGSKSADAPSPALHAVRKAKYVLASEPDSHDVWDSGLLKQITGGDKVTTRGVYGKHQVTWKPRFMLMVASNFFIKLDTKDDAMIRRIAPVHFNQVFRKPRAGETWESIPAEKRADEELTKRIVGSGSELSGVVNWLVEGMLGYLWLGGLGEPEAVEAHRQDMKEDLSNVHEFITEMLAEGYLKRVELDSDGKREVPIYKCLGVMEAHKAYKTWCVLNEIDKPRGRKQMSADLTADYTWDKKTVRAGGARGARVFDGLAWEHHATEYVDGREQQHDFYTRYMLADGKVEFDSRGVCRLSSGQNSTLPRFGDGL